MHAYPDGTKATPKPRERRRRQNAEGDLDIMARINLWDFLEEFDNRLDQLFLLELEAEMDSYADMWYLGDDTSSEDDYYWCRWNLVWHLINILIICSMSADSIPLYILLYWL